MPSPSPLCLSLSLLFIHDHVKYLHKVRAACLPFCNAVVSIAHLQQEEGESKRGKKAREGRGKQRERGGRGKGAANAAYHWRKNAARGSLTVNIAGCPPPLHQPPPHLYSHPHYGTANLHFLLSNFLGWQRCQTTRSQHWKFAWLDRKLFSQRKRQKEKERESEREKDLPK